MKPLILLIVLIQPFVLFSQDINSYFESIRKSNAYLTAFFSQMPKGGDLHHHFSGSVYAETYIAYVIENDLFINLKTFEISDSEHSDTNWMKFSKLDKPKLPYYKQKLLEKWSIKDYHPGTKTSEDHFFETFPSFSIAYRKTIDTGLIELKKRAQTEKVFYIETIFSGINCGISVAELSNYNDQLKTVQQKQNKTDVQNLLNQLYTKIKSKDIASCANAHNTTVTTRHNNLKIDDSTFLLRYQNYVSRTLDNPVELFKNLIIAFESALSSPLIVGVNIVSPEHNEVSMRDYWLHMQMFNFCRTKYDSVKTSMHAGELTLGLVKPEELTWHINTAVYDARADRIGHGVDIAYERNCQTLLKYMHDNKIPIEINLSSNEFILKVTDNDHPLMMYKKFKVPIVISTDDAGVLRTNLIHQYVLLAGRYKEIKYSDIKEFVFNSIRYSFIEEEKVKGALIKKLERRFREFEQIIIRDFPK